MYVPWTKILTSIHPRLLEQKATVHVGSFRALTPSCLISRGGNGTLLHMKILLQAIDVQGDSEFVREGGRSSWIGFGFSLPGLCCTLLVEYLVSILQLRIGKDLGPNCRLSWAGPVVGWLQLSETVRSCNSPSNACGRASSAWASCARTWGSWARNPCARAPWARASLARASCNVWFAQFADRMTVSEQTSCRLMYIKCNLEVVIQGLTRDQTWPMAIHVTTRTTTPKISCELPSWFVCMYNNIPTPAALSSVPSPWKFADSCINEIYKSQNAVWIRIIPNNMKSTHLPK